MLLPSDFGLPASLFPSFRRGQYSLAERVHNSDKRISLVMAPPGSGKSLVHYVISKLHGEDTRSLTLVSTKSLADQILRDPFGHVEIRGHSNYPCAPKIYDPSGEVSDLKCRLGRENGCYHQRKVEECLVSDSVLTNYAYWVNLAKIGQPDRLGKYDLLICDEGHLIHDLVSDLVAYEIHSSRLSFLLQTPLPDLGPDISSWLPWCQEIQSISRRKRALLSTSGQKDILLQLDRMDSELSRVLYESSRHPWAVERLPSAVKFSPVWSKPYIERYLFRDIKKIVISSGTLLPETADLLGIDKSSHSYFQVSSTFPPERRPFIYLPTCRVDWKMGEGHWRMLMGRIDKIIEDRLDRKGIIHCQSYDRGMEILRRSKWGEFLLTHNKHNKEEIVERFKREDSPCVLVSPSVSEGHDFKGDLCRYQIIVKVPYDDSRNPKNIERNKTNKTYRYVKAGEKILQQYGRSNRSEKDWSETFILDDHWGDYFHKTVKFPEYFKLAWRTESVSPESIQF